MISFNNSRSSTLVLLATILLVSFVPQRTTAMVSDLQMLVGINDSDHVNDLEVFGGGVASSISTLNRNQSTTTASEITATKVSESPTTTAATKYVRVMNLVVPLASSKWSEQQQEEEQSVTAASPSVEQEARLKQDEQKMDNQILPCIDSSFASPISIPLVSCTTTATNNSSSSSSSSRSRRRSSTMTRTTTTSRIPFSYPSSI